MLEVRLLPNGRIDMLSVDEIVRLNANMTHQMIATDMGKMLRQGRPRRRIVARLRHTNATPKVSVSSKRSKLPVLWSVRTRQK